jgi:GDP-L-fucose synthase
MIKKNQKIFVAGHRGMVGSAIIRKLKEKGYKNIITVDKKLLDLTDQKKVNNFFKKMKPEFIFMAAAKVGGIFSNDNYKADFIYENLYIQSNIISSAFANGIKNLIFLGSSCVYPRDCNQPIKEEYLLNGKLEKTNDAYAIAKIAGIKMCESYNEQYNTNYKCLMPTNAYGPNDNYHELNSHFIPALIKKIHNIKIKKKNTLVLWGDGSAIREVVYVDDIADACVYFMNKKTKHNLINIGTGVGHTIKDYAKKILKIVGLNHKVKIVFDKSKPNGTPKKVLNVNLAKKYGWKAKSELDKSIYKTYLSFLDENKIQKHYKK